MNDLIIESEYGAQTLKDTGFLGLQAIPAFDEEDAGKYYLILTNNKWFMRTIRNNYGIIGERNADEMLEEDFLAEALKIFEGDECTESEINYGVALELFNDENNIPSIVLGMDSEYGTTLTEALTNISKKYNILEENIFIAPEEK